jgi:type IV fimbrial biogenesis protein FimT
MLMRAQSRGISLIEILIGLAILGIGMAWAVPSYSVWMQNLQIRNMAESIVSGLQVARSEAISRNGPVEFVLMSANIVPANRDTDLLTLGDENGRNWMVRAVLPLGSPTNYAYITARDGAEGSSNATVQAGDANISGNLYAVTFDGFGRQRFSANGVVQNVDASAQVAKICVGSSKLSTANGARQLEINVSVSGQIKMCDPSLTSATDPRRCLTAAPRCS